MMKKTISNLFVLILLITIVSGIVSCKKEDPDINQELYKLAKDTVGFTWYGLSDALLEKSDSSGHPQTYLRVRFNPEAAGLLNTEGKLPAGSIFPEGSLVVKELWTATPALDAYAILYKKTGDPNADDKGWIWGYLDADGSVNLSASNQGKACIYCHIQEGNIDYMLLPKYFP